MCSSRKGQSMRTCVNLIDDLLCRLFVNVIHYDIRAAGTVEQRVPRGGSVTTGSSKGGKTNALPRPPPAPVTTTTCPLKERAIGGWKEESAGEMTSNKRDACD
jgi:hypothetical protein